MSATLFITPPPLYVEWIDWCIAWPPWPPPVQASGPFFGLRVPELQGGGLKHLIRAIGSKWIRSAEHCPRSPPRCVWKTNVFLLFWTASLPIRKPGSNTRHLIGWRHRRSYWTPIRREEETHGKYGGHRSHRLTHCLSHSSLPSPAAWPAAK